ncbi:hypothetical protein D3C72_1977210 [compost metagenome]
MAQPLADGFDNVNNRDLGGDIVLPGDQLWGNVVREVKVRHACQRGGFVVGDADDFAVVQAELAGEAQNFFGLSRHRKYYCNRAFIHVAIDGIIRVVDMGAEFSNVGKETRAVFPQCSGGADADENNALSSGNMLHRLI